MKKLIPIAVILSFAVWSGCSSDDPAPTEPPPPPPPPVRVVADTTVAAPTLSSVDEAIWDSVTEFTLDISTQNSPKLPGPASSIVSDSVYVKAIVSGGNLYLRIEYEDDDLNLLKDFHETIDSNLNFSRSTVSHEDQVYIMFSGLPNGDLDVWNWRSLTTGTAGVAEGFTFSNNTLVEDGGSQQVAFSNAHPIEDQRPVWVDTTSATYTGEILYIEDRDSLQKYLTAFREPGLVVPGWYIDTLVGARVQSTQYAQSRWDIFTVSSFDDLNEKITVVLKRKLNTTYSEDFVMTDSVQFRIGLLDDQKDIFQGINSRRGFTDLLWLIL